MNKAGENVERSMSTHILSNTSFIWNFKGSIICWMPLSCLTTESVDVIDSIAIEAAYLEAKI